MKPLKMYDRGEDTSACESCIMYIFGFWTVGLDKNVLNTVCLTCGPQLLGMYDFVRATQMGLMQEVIYRYQQCVPYFFLVVHTDFWDSPMFSYVCSSLS